LKNKGFRGFFYLLDFRLDLAQIIGIIALKELQSGKKWEKRHEDCKIKNH
jgi:hypothetical protein